MRRSARSAPAGSTVVAAAVLAVLAAACRGAPTEPEPCPEPSAAAATLSSLDADALQSRPSPYDDAFAAAGAEFDVPPALLKAIGWVETRWQMVEGAEEFPGRPPAFGVMALRGERLERGASLAGIGVDAARRDPVAHIRAAAALLDAFADESAIDRSQPEEWAPVVAQFSGIEVAEGRTAYLRQVDRTLAGTATGPTAALAVEPCPEPPDYAPAVWRPSPNFDARAADATGVPHLVIIHTCEGAYTGCWSWLVNPDSRVSAHYVIDEEGTEISQLVRERDRAWHIAAFYDCTLNESHDCGLNGVQSNHFTIGLEHAGFASQESFPATQIDASAALVCDITRDRDFPRDWQHVVGHGQLQPDNRTDPGPHWPWVGYLHRIQAHCGEIVTDDEAALNDAAVAAVAAPAEWIASDTTPGYYGAGYRWASTHPEAADVVAFAFLVDSNGERTVEARWTSGTNRSPRAEYIVITAAGDTVAAVRADQTTGGGAWHVLGTWSLPAGWNRVLLTRRDESGFVVVADAVRVRPR